MKIAKVLLASHVYSTESGDVYGPADVIKDYLENNKKNYFLIKYPLNSKTPLLIKSLFEILGTTFRGLLYRPEIFIGIDPLNALSGIILKKVGIVKRTIFYCVDFTPTRFENKIANAIYLKIDEYCAKNSDFVWNVSTRIVNLRRKQGIDEEKNKFVPNSPDFDKCPRLPIQKVNRNRIVMVSGLTHSPIFDLVLNSFKKLVGEFPRLKLVIIGTGSYQAKLELKVKEMNLLSNIVFLGQLLHEKLLQEVSKSRLALAIYTYSKQFSWVYYGDSKKAREYLACGVPVVITDVVATSDDIRKCGAGMVIKAGGDELLWAIEKLLSDQEFWLLSRKNAIDLAKKMDEEKILDNTLLPLL